MCLWTNACAITDQLFIIIKWTVSWLLAFKHTSINMDNVVIQADFVHRQSLVSLGCSFFSGLKMTVESNINVFTIYQLFSVLSGKKWLNYHFHWLMLSSFDFKFIYTQTKGANNEFLRRSQMKSTVIILLNCCGTAFHLHYNISCQLC